MNLEDSFPILHVQHGGTIHFFSQLDSNSDSLLDSSFSIGTDI